MFDMFKMMGKLNEVQGKMKEIKAGLGSIILEETELDAVTVELSADRRIRKIRTLPAFYDKYSLEEREEILTEAVNNALAKADARAKEETQKGMEGVMPNIPGLDLSSLGMGS